MASEEKVGELDLSTILMYAFSNPGRLMQMAALGGGVGLGYASLKNIAAQRQLHIELPFDVYNFDVVPDCAKEFQLLYQHRNCNKDAYDNALSKTDYVLGLIKTANEKAQAGDAKMISDEIKKIHIQLLNFEVSTVGDKAAMQQIKSSKKKIKEYLVKLYTVLYPKLQNFSLIHPASKK